MKTKLVVFLLAAGLLVAMSTSMFAHHSNAISDKDRLVTMTGTVTKFAFINPHVGITFDAKDEHGNVAEGTRTYCTRSPLQRNGTHPLL